MNPDDWSEILKRNGVYGWLSLVRDSEEAFCPFCGNKDVARCDGEILKSFVKDSTVLYVCSECESLFGRYT